MKNKLVYRVCEQITHFSFFYKSQIQEAIEAAKWQLRIELTEEENKECWDKIERFCISHFN